MRPTISTASKKYAEPTVPPLQSVTVNRVNSCSGAVEDEAFSVMQDGRELPLIEAKDGSQRIGGYITVSDARALGEALIEFADRLSEKE